MSRFVGTGKDPRYPKGVVVDIATAEDSANVGNTSEQDLVEMGYVVAADPYQDPGRTVSQIANAVVRGDILSNSYDAAVAVKEGLVDEDGAPSARAYDIVHEAKQSTDEGREDLAQRGEQGGPVRGVLSAIAAVEDRLPKAEGADTVVEDIAAPGELPAEKPKPAAKPKASSSASSGD